MDVCFWEFKLKKYLRYFKFFYSILETVVYENYKLMKNKSVTNFIKKSGAITPSNDTQMCKVFRRKPNLNNSQSRILKKTQSKPNLNDLFCYISPDKIFANGANTSQKFIQNKKEFFPQSKWHLQSHKNIPNSTNQSYERTCYIPSMQYICTNASETTKQQEYQQELKNLKENQIKNIRKINQLSVKLKMVKEENYYLFQRIQDISKTMEQSEQENRYLRGMLAEKDQTIEELSHQLSIQRDNILRLTNVIQQLQKTIQSQNIETNNTASSSFFTECSEDKYRIEQELQTTKQQLYELKQKLKYSHIQQVMLQKLRFQNNSLYTQKIKLRILNKKLTKRLEHLAEKLQNIQKKERKGIIENSMRSTKQNKQINQQKYQPYKKNSNEKSEEQFQFSLSPDK